MRYRDRKRRETGSDPARNEGRAGLAGARLRSRLLRSSPGDRPRPLDGSDAGRSSAIPGPTRGETTETSRPGSGPAAGGEVIVLEVADHHAPGRSSVSWSGPKAGIFWSLLEVAVQVGGARLADHPGDPLRASPRRRAWGRRACPPSVRPSIDVAGPAFLLERLVARVVGDARAMTATRRASCPAGICANEATKSATSSSSPGFELRALLPLGHAVALRHLAEVGGRLRVLEQAANPGAGAEVGEVGGGLRRRSPAPSRTWQPRHRRSSTALPVGERVAAQEVGRAVGRDAGVGRAGQRERPLARGVGLLSRASWNGAFAASSRIAWTVR